MSRKHRWGTSGSPYKITSLYVQRLWFVSPWLTHRRTHTYRQLLTGYTISSTAELKNTAAICKASSTIPNETKRKVHQQNITPFFGWSNYKQQQVDYTCIKLQSSAGRLYLYLVFKHSVRIFLKEHIIDSHVKRRNHFLRVCYQLTIEIGVELTQVFTVEVEKRLANDTYLCKIWHTNDAYICTTISN